MTHDIITGATGFLGKALVLRWMSLNLKTDKKLIILSRNPPSYLDEYQEYLDKFEYIKFDLTQSKSSKFPTINDVETLFHCAAIASINSKWDDLFKTNVLGIENLINWVCSSKKIKRVIFISSTLACGYDLTGKKYCNFDLRTGSNPNTPYGKSKYESELKIKNLSKRYDFQLVIIRPPYIFGPGMRTNGGFAKFIYMVQNDSFAVRLNYPGLLSYTFIDNFVSILIFKAKEGLNSEDFFYADSPPIANVELFQLIGKLTREEIKSIGLPDFFYKFISTCLVFFYKIPFLKEKVPIYMLPLFKKNIGCVDYNEINTGYKKLKTVSLEEGLKKTIQYLNKL